MFARRLIPSPVLLACLALPAPAAAATPTDAQTRYPIVLSHHWSGNAFVSFRGSTYQPGLPETEPPFPAWGVKRALEAAGAVVYQPDKIDYASHQTRGKLLYRKCAGTALAEKLCTGPNPQVIDGVELAMQDYCRTPAKHRGQYAGYADCIQRVKVNVVCHSQGCPDSRYMINALTNRLTGRPMYEHVASWTSLAGANKGTVMADLALGCTDGNCGPDYVKAVTALCGSAAGCPDSQLFHESVVALSRKYMTETMDMSCNPQRQSCPPSFNRAYPNHPSVYWQTFSGTIRWLHSCYSDQAIGWLLVGAYEGVNDGRISLDSQRFVTAGPAANEPPTYVHDRGIITGTSRVWGLNHPGLTHMAFSNARVPGLPGVDCSGLGDDQAAYSWDREAFFVQVARELKGMGF